MSTAAPLAATIFRKHKSSTLAGHAEPLHRRFRISQQQVTVIWHSIRDTVHGHDLLLLAAIGVLTAPLLRLPYELIPSFSAQPAKKKRFRDTVYYQIADHVQQVTKLALAVYAVDIVKLVCTGLEVNACGLADALHAFTSRPTLTPLYTLRLSVDSPTLHIRNDNICK